MVTIHDLGVEKFAGNAEDWKKTLVSGSTFWVSGNSPVFDVGIKIVTGSPLTHTGSIYQCPITKRWLVLESQIGVNVRIGSLDYYLEKEKIPIVVGTHKDFKPEMLPTMLDFGQQFLDEQYDTEEIAKIFLHRISPHFTVHPDKHAFICSELEAARIKSAGLELDVQLGGNTPASLFADSHMLHQSMFVP